jgi:hypothetical protein
MNKQIQSMNKPVYRLQELIIAKYGEDNFALGCYLTGQWVKFFVGQHYLVGVFQWVYQLCNFCEGDEPEVLLRPQEAEALRQLFGLTSVEELYNEPEPVFSHGP